MKHSAFRIIALILVLGFSVSVLIFSSFRFKKTAEAREQLQELPSFEFQKGDGQIFTRDMLKSEQRIWICLLDVSCSSCWDQLEVFCRLSPQINNRNVQLLLVVDGNEDEQRLLIRYLQDRQSLLSPVIASANSSGFGEGHSRPMLYCYNEQWHLEASYRGAVKGEILLSLLQTHKMYWNEHDQK